MSSIKKSIEQSVEEVDLRFKRSTPRERTVSRMRRILLTTMGICISESCFQACILDPPPPPYIQCIENGSSSERELYDTILSSGTWISSPPDLSASLSFSVTNYSDNFDLVEFSGIPTAEEAVIENVIVSENNKTITFECTPLVRRHTIEIIVPVSCGDYENQVLYLMQLDFSAAAGEPVKIFPHYNQG